MADRRIIIQSPHSGEWYWRQVAPNHLIVASSGETFKNHQYAIESAQREFDGVIIDSDGTEVPPQTDWPIE